MIFEATEVSLGPGAYRARLKNIEEADGTNFETGEPEKYRRWIFEILEEGFEGTELFASSTMAFGPRRNARKWVEALLGRKIESHEKIGLEHLQGLEVDLGVVLKETHRGSFGKVDSSTLFVSRVVPPSKLRISVCATYATAGLRSPRSAETRTWKKSRSRVSKEGRHIAAPF